jgi:hypothetical protein
MVAGTTALYFVPNFLLVITIKLRFLRPNKFRVKKEKASVVNLFFESGNLPLTFCKPLATNERLLARGLDHPYYVAFGVETPCVFQELILWVSGSEPVLVCGLRPDSDLVDRGIRNEIVEASAAPEQSCVMSFARRADRNETTTLQANVKRFRLEYLIHFRSLAESLPIVA